VPNVVCAVLTQVTWFQAALLAYCAGLGSDVPVPLYIAPASKTTNAPSLVSALCSYVFPVDLGNDPIRVWSAASQEIGHTLGLYHDMLVSTLPGCSGYPNQTNYYDGQFNNYYWAPIMGEGGQPQILTTDVACIAEAAACKDWQGTTALCCSLHSVERVLLQLHHLLIC
jgi:hypothetical protein